MNTKQTEALKLALEALKQIDEAMPLPVAKLAQQVIREALAEQPAQQEVDWEKLYRLEVKKKEALAAKYERDTGKKLTRIIPMAEQPAQQQDIPKIGCVNHDCDKCKAQQQEPVAQKPYAYEYGVDNGDGTYSVQIDRGSLIHTGVQYEYCAPRNPHRDHPVTPLYTAQPASKPWVGLSTIELDEIDAPIRERGHATIAEIYRAIESKLREKNA